MDKNLRGLSLILVVGLLASGCGDSKDVTTPTTNGPGSGSQTIVISGSSTVEPISARVGQRFDSENPAYNTTVEGPGTGDGFKRFCAGETDISDASRPIKDSEREACAAAGVEFVELHIATDGITVMTHPENDSVACLTLPDLYALTGPESEGFSKWSDANTLAAELGGTGNFPSEPLYITGPGEESGTYDTYVELVIEALAEERGAENATRVDYNASANDNVIVQGITSNLKSLGWVGFAFYSENRDELKAIAVDAGQGCVEPTEESIASFEYSLSRPLFIYVRTDNLADRPAVVAFVDYFLSDAGLAAVGEAGYVAIPNAEIAETRDAWTAAKG